VQKSEEDNLHQESEQFGEKHLEKDGDLKGVSHTLLDATHELDVTMAYMKVEKYRIHNSTELFETELCRLGPSH
jgi:hypothetical protein